MSESRTFCPIFLYKTLRTFPKKSLEFAALQRILSAILDKSGTISIYFKTLRTLLKLSLEYSGNYLRDTKLYTGYTQHYDGLWISLHITFT